MHTQTLIIPHSSFLHNQTATSSKLSDHNIVIQGRTVFFNMMMRCRWNPHQNRFNNGFAKEESHREYQQRIQDVVALLAETIHNNPHIHFIGLAEAPIRDEDIRHFIQAASQHPCLSGFIQGDTKKYFTSMGVATLINRHYFTISSDVTTGLMMHPCLIDRVQCIKASAQDQSETLMIVNLHFLLISLSHPCTKTG